MGTANQCTACAVGGYAYSSIIGGNTSDVCSTCNPGSYYGITNSTPFCVACDSGTYSSAIYSLVCVACTPGTYSSVVGAITCPACAAGTYSSMTAALHVALGATLLDPMPLPAGLVLLEAIRPLSVQPYAQHVLLAPILHWHQQSTITPALHAAQEPIHLPLVPLHVYPVWQEAIHQ
jgi:Tyrosine-protein kinase ephrin type A/B receptor-like